MKIDLEANAAVDDIVVQFADTSKAFIQAKLSSDLGAPFKSAVSQWCTAIKEGQCNDDDELLLIVAEPSGSLKELARNLIERRNGAALSEKAKNNLRALRELITKRGLDEAQRERLLSSATIRFIDARHLGPYEGQGAAWLDAAVVQAGRGTAAFTALRAAIRDEAAYRGSSSTLERWRHWLSKAGIPFVSDQDGLLAAQLQAEEDAISEYCGRLTRDQDMLPLADLNFGLVSLHIPGLAAGLKATRVGEQLDDGTPREKQDLLKLVRREGRLVLVGLPGAGKSVALKLIAAKWGSSPRAPLPVQAKLSDIAHKIPLGGPYRLSAPELVEAALQDEDPTLSKAMIRRLERGECILLLDALDEVVDKRDATIEALSSLLDELPSSIDIVVTTRHSSSKSAKAFAFPTFELNEPDDLDSTLDILLQKLAETRGAESTGWLQERRSYIEDSRKADRHLWQVPLLATLMVLLLVERAPQQMPDSRAVLLVEIIEASVHRWEARRSTTGIPGITESLTGQVLLDCYDDIAHFVAQDKANWSHVLKAIEKRLREYWGKSQGEAKAAAEGILNHWDATAGVFTTSHPRGQLVARTRLFAEIGEARWVLRDDARAGDWLRTSAPDPELRECVRLAAGLSMGMCQALCDLALEEGNDLLDLALSAIEDGGHLDSGRESALKRAEISRVSTLPLSPTHENIGKLRIPGHSAPASLAVRLARTNLSEDELEMLYENVRRMGTWQVAVVRAIAMASHAHRGGAQLPSEALDALEQALFDPDRGEDLERRPAGLNQVVQLALKELVPTRPATAYRVAATAYRGSMSVASKAEYELKRLGHENILKKARGERKPLFTEESRRAMKTLSKYDRNEPFCLLTKIDNDAAELTHMQAWHLDEAAALVQALDVNYAGLGMVHHAVNGVPEITLDLFRSIAAGFAIDAEAAVAELKSLQRENPEHPDWYVLVVPCERRPIPEKCSPIASPDLLLRAYATNNEWLADLATDLAWEATDLTGEWCDKVTSLCSGLDARIRRMVGMIVAKHWVDAAIPDDPVARSGFARIAAQRCIYDQNMDDAEQLLRDPDLLVRESAADVLSGISADKKGPLIEALSSPAEQWTCIYCDYFLDINRSACKNHHARPRPSLTD